MKKYKKIISVSIFGVLAFLGLACIKTTPILEMYLSAPLKVYGDTPIGHISFVIIRVFNVVLFPLKLNGFTSVFNRVVGFRTSVELSFVIQTIGGTIVYFLGRLFYKKFLLRISSYPLGDRINNVLFKFQNIALNNKLKSILFFIGFSYEPFGYLAGIQNRPFWDYFLCLLVGGSVLNFINISRDMMIGQNDSLALTLQLVPLVLALILTVIYLREELLTTLKSIKKIVKKYTKEVLPRQKII